MLSESAPLDDDDSGSTTSGDENLGLLNIGPRRVVHRRDTKLRDHWKQTLSAVDSIKENIPSGNYLKLVNFIKEEWARS